MRNGCWRAEVNFCRNWKLQDEDFRIKFVLRNQRLLRSNLCERQAYQEGVDDHFHIKDVVGIITTDTTD